MDEKRFCLVSDDDGHWFICPAEKASEFSKWVEKTTKYWDSLPDDEDPPAELPYIKAIGGSPSRVTFLDPIISLPTN